MSIDSSTLLGQHPGADYRTGVRVGGLFLPWVYLHLQSGVRNAAHTFIEEKLTLHFHGNVSVSTVLSVWAPTKGEPSSQQRSCGSVHRR